MEFPLLRLLLSHCGSSEPVRRPGGDTGGGWGVARTSARTSRTLPAQSGETAGAPPPTHT